MPVRRIPQRAEKDALIAALVTVTGKTDEAICEPLNIYVNPATGIPALNGFRGDILEISYPLLQAGFLACPSVARGHHLADASGDYPHSTDIVESLRGHKAILNLLTKTGPHTVAWTGRRIIDCAKEPLTVFDLLSAIIIRSIKPK